MKKEKDETNLTFDIYVEIDLNYTQFKHWGYVSFFFKRYIQFLIRLLLLLELACGY